MSSDTRTPVKSTALAAVAQDTMSNTAKKFIGAVEDEWQLFSDNAADYAIGSPIGFGASSIVYAATYHPRSPDSSSPPPKKGIRCALKVLDLDSLPPRSLQLLQRETTLMSLSKHPNVLRVRGSWVNGHKLYIALRLMNKGSAADVMRYGWPGGMEEDVVRCILRQALSGLNYLHINGFIHRDVKAANLLIDDDGTVLLGDLGVAADLTEDTSQISSSSSKAHSISARAALESSSGKHAMAFDGVRPVMPRPRIGKRKSFVGTPCWMSPELIEGKQYDSSTDIWSFGITALELTQGRPPRSRESPQKVLLKTIQEDPPTLNREGGTFKYSRAFKEVIDSCLVKDPSKRPNAEELLQTPFFKAAKKKSYLINTILKDLPPLTQRQERCVLPAVLSANSIDSWDFTPTPTASVYRRRPFEDFVTSEDEELRAEGVFEMDDEARAASSHHSRVVSWTSEAEQVPEEVEPEPETNFVPSSSPSTSESSSFLSSSMGASQASSPPGTSAPSSYTGSSDIALRLREAVSSPDTGQKVLSGITGHSSHPTLVGLRTVLPEVTPVKRTQKAPVSPGPTLWHKLKGNARRPALETDGSESSPRKDKEKRRMSDMFSSASKGLLSRGSSRSLSSGTPS
ncbi:hypothetical protein GALMADRAFT_217914 [Galerina marginata CBS 339.88]|uniref:Protein kinase domain-containing protein n=1 Tax=Galerina marginata (strain CBS 339.88) TaxID=685588 RepID=A0A067TNN2_GALM3|nr:hypothetical protein GALMADRAFT_217914 [Galerina marginata CBS 339.88]